MAFAKVLSRVKRRMEESLHPHLGVRGSGIAKHAPHVRRALLRRLLQLPRMLHLSAGSKSRNRKGVKGGPAPHWPQGGICPSNTFLHVPQFASLGYVSASHAPTTQQYPAFTSVQRT